MEISRRLCLVQPIETSAGTLWLHSMPISREVWETYFLVLAKTYAEFLKQGLTVIAGPPVARLLLRRVAELSGAWDGQMGVERGLLPEIRRLSNVILPGKAGWETMPFEQVIQQNIIDGDALAEAEGAVIFFTCVSAVLRGPAAREKLEIMLNGLASLWNAQITPLDVTGFLASLPISTPAENTGAKVTVSSIPS